MVKELTRPATPLRRGAAPDTAWAFFDGEFVPLRDAKVSVLTHAFNYGTGVFEGIRAYWNADRKQLYGLHLLEHYRRLHRSCKIMRLDLPYTPEPVSDNILEGIVRASIMRIAGDLGIPVVERSIDRTELYIADELFLCGTGAQLSPVTSVDHRKVGDGAVGPVTQRLSRVYFDAVRAISDRYKEWVTPVYPA